MKSLTYSLLTLLGSAAVLSAQESELPVPPIPPAPPEIFVAQAGVPPPSGVNNVVSTRAGGGMSAKSGKGYGVLLGTAAGRGVHVAAAPVSEKVRGEIEEDLAIMDKLLDDAVAVENKQARHAMGIAVNTILGNSPSSSLHIDGYGALFQVDVGFPLKGPSDAAKPEDSKKEDTNNTAWNQARQQLFGVPSVGGTPEKVEYDADRVNDLKEAILQALGNAGNMRHVKGDEFVTVVVREGRDGAGHLFASAIAYAAAPGGPAQISRSGSTPGGSGSTMTIRIKKSDAESVAKGKLKKEEFQKKALVVFN